MDAPHSVASSRLNDGLLWAGLLNLRALGDRCQVRLNGVGLKHLTEICSKKVDGVLGSRQSGKIELVTEGVVLPDPCPVGGGRWRGHSSVEEVSQATF